MNISSKSTDLDIERQKTFDKFAVFEFLTLSAEAYMFLITFPSS